MGQRDTSQGSGWKGHGCFPRIPSRNLLASYVLHPSTSEKWKGENSSWTDCHDLLSCPKKYAAESIRLACEQGYNRVQEGMNLADDYFDSTMPIVAERIAQGGVRLAMTLNRVFGEHNQAIPSPF
ncbi:unnamed protein product [Musa hybrid cultivar]